MRIKDKTQDKIWLVLYHKKCFFSLINKHKKNHKIAKLF